MGISRKVVAHHKAFQRFSSIQMTGKSEYLKVIDVRGVGDQFANGEASQVLKE